MLIEALTHQDFRTYIKGRILAPLGLEDDVFVGLPPEALGRACDIYDPKVEGAFVPRTGENTPEHHAAGIPGGGGYGTARGMAAFYQALGHGGALGGVRILAPRTLEYVTRNFTGDRIDEYMGLPMTRGIGPHSRGTHPVARGLGTIAPSADFSGMAASAVPIAGRTRPAASPSPSSPTAAR